MKLKGKRITKLLVLSMILVVLVTNVLGISAANAVELWLSDPVDNTDEFSDPLPNSIFEDAALRDRGAGWALLGDADFNGFVGLDDLAVWTDNYGKREGEWESSIDPDLDDNGIVDEADYDVWFNNWGAKIIYTRDAREPFAWSWHFSYGNGKGDTPFWLKNWVSNEAVNAIRHYARANHPYQIDVAFSFLFFPEALTGAYVIAEVEVFSEGGGSDVFSGEPFYFNEAELEWTQVSVTVPISREVVGIKVKIGGYGEAAFRAWIDEAKFTILEREVNSHDYGNLACSVNVLSYEINTQDSFEGQVTLGISAAADSPPWAFGEHNDWILRNIMLKVELLPNDGTNTTQPGQLNIRWFEHGNDKGFDLSPSQIDQANRDGTAFASFALGTIGSVAGLLIFPPGATAWWASFLFSAAWRTGTSIATMHAQNLRTTYEHTDAHGGSDYAVWENCDYYPWYSWEIKTAYSYLEVDWVFDTDSLDPTYAVRVTAQATWLDNFDPSKYHIEETTTEVRVTRNTPIRDVSVTNVIASPTSVLVGEPVTINATVKNEGDNIENVEVNTYYDDSNFIGKQTVNNLAPGSSTTLTYTWYTTGVPVGVHTIKAVASPVLGETDTVDNIGTATVNIESPLVTILNDLGFTNIQESNVSTFEPGIYIVKLYAEFAGRHAQNELSWYEVGTTQYNLIFSGPEGNLGYVDPPIVKTFTTNSQFGLSFFSSETRYFTETSENPDGIKHAMIYRNLDNPSMYLIGFEDTLGGGDLDYNDMVISLEREYHDVAVTSVTFVLPYEATSVYPGWVIDVLVTVQNEGDYSEGSILGELNVTAYYGGNAIDTMVIIALASGTSVTVPFTWTVPTPPTWTPYPPQYTISAEVEAVPGETDTADNVFVDGSVTVKWPGDCNGDGHVNQTDVEIFLDAWSRQYPDPEYNCTADFNGDGWVKLDDLNKLVNNMHKGPLDYCDINVTSITFSYGTTVVYPTWVYPLQIYVTVKNNGSNTETNIQVTAYYNTTAVDFTVIDTKQVNITAGFEEPLTFIWNIPNATWPYLNYTIKANATLGCDENPDNNERIDGTVTVRWPGDCNGDGFVDLADQMIFLASWSKGYGDPDYDPRADFTGDGFVDLADLMIFLSRWFTGPP